MKNKKDNTVGNRGVIFFEGAAFKDKLVKLRITLGFFYKSKTLIVNILTTYIAKIRQSYGKNR